MVNKADVEKAYAVLDLDRQIVGIKIVKSKAEFEQAQAKELTYPLAYCVAVKLATNGKALKMTKEFSGCRGSTRALGLTPSPESFYNGQDGCALGLYESSELAASVARQMKYCPPDTYGVIIKPLEQFESDPDVVLMVGDSYQIMRVIQGYSYVYGLQPNFNMLGNQAVCVECTSYPLMTNQINVSLFCSGTRFLAKWRHTEVAVGIPYEKFGKVIEGVRLTVNAVEMNERKKVIQAKLAKLGYDGSEIRFNYTYYLKLEQDKQKQKQRKEVD
ncbi:hypothetical protein Desor_1800 [Desulfosporosinus orientis DSM 765]|uniref:DUF169 domain-containing protein n=1 Tax=Desulfosporosinus orientis (strain ATCC 19365 / DSM 765 / NCIMB 8382 / VKM B-1628 / Singapore I) TaxID=768706 RepID=G7W8K9_DESOD|nr:DUF169 domain-containing protein [Desulfosporosinus orientis]AET67436.1 hypothetical protein Desor_1800 [Desulfosporosinus orientis DSM 765]